MAIAKEPSDIQLGESLLPILDVQTLKVDISTFQVVSPYTSLLLPTLPLERKDLGTLISQANNLYH